MRIYSRHLKLQRLIQSHESNNFVSQIMRAQQSKVRESLKLILLSNKHQKLNNSFNIQKYNTLFSLLEFNLGAKRQTVY